MTEGILTSRQNPLIKQMRKLRHGKERREQNLILLEGTNLIGAACQENYPLVTLCYTQAWQSHHPQLWQNATQKAGRVELVSEELLGAIATTVNPDGVVATISRGIISNLPTHEIDLGLIVERIQDPGNLGTIIRTAVATGVGGLWLSEDSVALDNPKLLRASAGEWLRMQKGVSSNLIEVVSDLRSDRMQVVATLPQASKTYWEVDFRRPTLILLGNEKAGLSEELSTLADEKISIPLQGGVESLNVAIASALLLYEIQRQRLSIC
ncbi:MAG: RNA methyltransferase [Spirulinaceae cyanobacterium]